ncbi:hypothetical protein N7474_000767 [Penicillium riverlandense]|uniref:uncharacterized protein n=1 Tax=Penicillium riverlandense TaxID=1903569 RepID=UPI0025478850|nr:uncharacterized protein N7474_000767 [Penicillium riverlandense]KAJ5832456.1 hypothetical protein N7474_000767 [Penicillium riverlandense]
MVIPIQSRLRDMSLTKAAVLAPVASTDPAQVCFSWSGSSYDCSPMSNPSAPPPTPSDSLLDLNPRKTSFSSELGMGAACAFPSWPNRPSLSRSESPDSFSNAYLSDEDLLWMPTSSTATSPNSAIEDAPCKDALAFPASMNMEQQLERIRAAAAEEEDRARFLAKVEAHARATQALRMAKLAIINERETASTKRKKRRAVATLSKRRAHSSSAKVTAHA